MRSDSPTGANTRRGLRTLDRLRGALPPSARRAVRRVVDPMLRSVGSIKGAKTSERVVALTFDDGPDPVWTPLMLDVLASHDVPATFFVLLERAQAYPSIIGRAVSEGHEVALHGVDHRRLVGLLRSGGTRAPGPGAAAARGDGGLAGGRTSGRRSAPRAFAASAPHGASASTWSSGARTPRTGLTRHRRVRRPGAGRAGARAGYFCSTTASRPSTGPTSPRLRSSGPRRSTSCLRGMAEDGYRATSVGKLLDLYPARRTAWFRA